MINDPKQQEQIRKALQEISDAKTRVAAERDLIKDIVATLHEDFKDRLTKRQINKLAKTFHARSFSEEVAAMEEFEVLYETVVGEV